MLTLTLTEAELVEITRRERPSAQTRILKALGIPFAIHPVDGFVLVDRGAARAALGAPDVAANDEPPPTVNLEAFRSRKHGSQEKRGG